MPTRSEPLQRGGWAPPTGPARRSIFTNYRADGAPPRESPRPEAHDQPCGPAPAPPSAVPVDLAVARSFIHRYLAKAFETPTPEGWVWLCQGSTQESLAAAALTIATAGSDPASSADPLTRSLDALSTALSRGDAASFHDAYFGAFGHAARGSCPLNEIEYGDLRADPLFQPHRLADVAAFYRAFGLEVAADAGERHDHLCLQLEFMCVLAAKEAYALAQRLPAEHLAQCRDAQRKFLREHLGRWTPAFTRRLAATTDEPALRALAEFTRAFVESECARFGVTAGGEDLLLRPVDESAESMCASCGLASLPPGAAPAEGMPC